MNRRSFLATLSGLLASIGITVPGAKAEHDPLVLGISPAPEIDKRVVRPPHEPIYARWGEWVTCENGHDICSLIRDVKIGQIQDPPNDFGWWQQEEPKVGTLPLPRCAKCNAQFTLGLGYHFKDGWRSIYKARP